jgi:protoporphyrinogen/coproporphyrinogen III oxidase
MKGQESPVSYPKVISTIDSKGLWSMTDDKLPSLATAHAVDIMTVNLWYSNPNLIPKGSLGYLVPRSTETNAEDVLGVFFDSEVLKVTAEPESPPGSKFFVLMGGHWWDHMTGRPTDSEGITMAINAVSRHMGITGELPKTTIAGLARRCIPQHYVGHWQVMGATHKELLSGFNGTLAVAGGSYTDIGVMPSLRAGYDIATHVAGSSVPHVGDTGLAQFVDSELKVKQVSRSNELLGELRGVKPEPQFLRHLR